MDIHVHLLRGDGQVHHHHGVAAPGEEPLIGGLDGGAQDAVLDHPAVHQEHLEARAGDTIIRDGDHPGGGPGRPFQGKGQEVLGRVGPVNGRHPLHQGLGGGGGEQGLFPGREAEMHPGVAQGQVAHGLKDLGLLCLPAFEELAAHRRVEKKIGDGDLGAPGRGRHLGER